MINSKLYIPTSTLNFNSIMSCESISPAGFYSVRGFGYKRFEKVAPNDLENRIILYDKYPIFEINDKELENYPLVIEIEIETINADILQQYKDGIYYSEQTIYFNPFKTKFFFREEREKSSTLSKAEPSIEAKMVPLYKNCFLIKEESVQSFDWKPSKIADTNSNFDMQISKDRKVNKLKGVIYAYLLGINKSLPNEVVSLKKSAKELKNVLSAVISSPNGQATYKQEQQLSELYERINDSFYKVEGLNEKLHNILKQKGKHYHCDNFSDILKGEDLFESWCNRQNLRPSYQIKNFSIPYSSSSDERQRLFDNYFSELERNIGIFASTKNANIEDLPIIQHCNSIVQIPNQKGILKKLLDEYLSEAYTRTEFLQSRYDFAFSGGKIFREELYEKWDGSDYQIYINSLLKNLKEYTSFDLNNTSSFTLKSFGAFCQKGDDEIDKLEDYLISNNIADFRIAFSLWGVVFGFANMPKTLTNDLFLSDSLEYISEIYKYIFKQVHGIELKGKFERTQDKESAIIIPSKLNGQQPENIAHVTTNVTLLERELSEFKEFTSKDKIVRSEIITKLTEVGIYSLSDWDDKRVDSIKWATTKGQKKIVSAIKKTKAKTQPKSKTKLGFPQNQGLLFKCNTTGVFLDDLEFLLSNEDFVNIVSTRKDWKKDLKWFIESHDKSHKDYERYWKGKPTDNESIIKQFIFLKKEEYKDCEVLLRKLYL